MRRFFPFLAVCLWAVSALGVTVRNGYTSNTFGTINAQLQVTSYTLTGPDTNQTLVANYTSRAVALLKLAPSSYPRPELQISSSVGTSSVNHQPTSTSSLVFRDIKSGTLTDTRPVTAWAKDGTRSYVGLAVGSGSGAFPSVSGKLYLDTPILPYQISLRNSSGATCNYEMRDSSGALLGYVTLEPGQAVSAPVYSQAGGNVAVIRKGVTPVWDGYGIVPGVVSPEGGWPVTEVPPNTPVEVDNPSSPNDVPMPPQWDPSIPGANALSQAVYQLGVDRIIEAVRGSGGGGGEATDLTPITERLDKALVGDAPDLAAGLPETEFTGKAADVGRVLAKVPQVPTVEMPGSQAQFAFTMSVPRLDGSAINVPLVYDFSRFDTAITIFKGLVRAVLVVWFFFLVVRSLKGAFAT